MLLDLYTTGILAQIRDLDLSEIGIIETAPSKKIDLTSHQRFGSLVGSISHIQELLSPYFTLTRLIGVIDEDHNALPHMMHPATEGQNIVVADKDFLKNPQRLVSLINHMANNHLPFFRLGAGLNNKPALGAIFNTSTGSYPQQNLMEVKNILEAERKKLSLKF